MVMVVDDSGMMINYWWLTNTIYYIHIYIYICIDLWRFPIKRGTPQIIQVMDDHDSVLKPMHLGIPH